VAECGEWISGSWYLDMSAPSDGQRIARQRYLPLPQLAVLERTSPARSIDCLDALTVSLSPPSTRAYSGDPALAGNFWVDCGYCLSSALRHLLSSSSFLSPCSTRSIKRFLEVPDLGQHNHHYHPTSASSPSCRHPLCAELARDHTIQSYLLFLCHPVVGWLSPFLVRLVGNIPSPSFHRRLVITRQKQNPERHWLAAPPATASQT